MGLFSEYLTRNMSAEEIVLERKKQLRRISELRGNRPIIVIAGALMKQAPVGFNYDDRIPIIDQIRNIEGGSLDIILETPGGYAEIVEDIVRYIRGRFQEVAIIVPGYAKSAGTIFAMAGDEILMEPSSALGPIDAQVQQGDKRFSAHALLQGLEKIKEEVIQTGVLNRAYIPILQNISPGEIQSCENSLEFAQQLVAEWLVKYKFKFWTEHETTGEPVTEEEKKARAKEIASKLCDHGKWLTHNRSITITDLRGLGLKISDYSEDPDLFDAIRRYYILLQMTFEGSNTYKLFETPESQIYRQQHPEGVPQSQIASNVIVSIQCTNCGQIHKLQGNFVDGVPLRHGAVPFPKDNLLECESCGTKIDLSGMRKEIEDQAKRPMV